MRRADRQQCLVLARRQSRLGGLAFAECRELTQRIAKAGQRLIIGVSKGLVVVHGISHKARQRLKNVAVRYKRHAIPKKGNRKSTRLNSSHSSASRMQSSV